MSRTSGVKRVLLWSTDSVNPAAPSRDAFNGVKKALDGLNMNTIPRERWRVNVNILRHIAKDGHEGQGKDLMVFSTRALGNKRFLCLRNEKLLLECDEKVYAVLNKTQLYKYRFSIVVDGPSYSLGDFSACWGQALMHPNNKPIGLVLEVEYHPVQDIETGNHVLNHFLDLLHSATVSLGGRFIPIDPHFPEYHLGSEYTSQHNTLQYIHLTAVLLQPHNIRAAGIPMGISGTPGVVGSGDSVSSTPVGTPAVGT